MYVKLRKTVRSFIPLSFILPFYNFVLRIRWRFRGFKIYYSHGLFRIIKNNKEIRHSRVHQLYFQDTLENFDFYFQGVVPAISDNMEIVDYSVPQWHDVKDFDLFPVFFNSVSEPVVTANQYIKFANLSSGHIAIDLGAYSALTSILIDRQIQNGGLVIAVEADKNNIIACQKNLALYKKVTNRHIELVNAAIWDHMDGINFSAEGNMGSSATEVVGSDRAENVFVKTVTLNSLVEKFNLLRVDFIKCDIEGAETVALNCPDFFLRFRPKIVIECHLVNGISTEFKCKEILQKLGYDCELQEQHGYPLPLLFCTPRSNS